MADFRITVVIDPTGAQRGGRKVEQSLKRVGGQADRLRGLLLRTFGALGITAAFTGSIRLLAQYEQEMSTVRAVTGATEVQFKSLQEEAKRLGITTRFSANQAAEGMVFLARAGFEVDQVMASIGDTLRLAQAGALDLGRAADIASNILTGFRINANDAARVVDVLALAANSTNTNVSQLGDAMKFVAPVAAGLGVSLEQTTAAVGALSNAGLQATLAGTGLKRVLAELESPTSKSRKILKALGVTTDEVRITQVGLVGALERLRDAGIDTGLALQLFGQRGGPAFDIMVKALPKIKQLDENLQNAAGTAKRIADVMDDNLNGALLAVKSAFEGLVIELGAAGAGGALTNFLRNFAEKLRFLAANVELVTGAFEALAVVLTIKLAQKAIPAAIAGFNSLTIAIAANPIGALVTVLTVVVALFIGFADKVRISSDGITTLKDLTDEVFDSFDVDIKAATDALLLFIPPLRLAINLFKSLSEVESLEDFLLNFARGLDATIPFLKALGNTKIGTGFGDRFKDNFKRELEQNGGDIENSLLDVFGGAAERAQARLIAGGDFFFKDNITDADILGTPGQVTAPEVAPVAGSSIDTSAGLAKTFPELVRELEEENRILTLTNQEREIQGGLLDAEDQLKRELTVTERALFEGLLLTNQARADEAIALDQVVGPLEAMERGTAALNSLLASGKISLIEYTEQVRDLRIAFLETAEDAASGFERGLLRIQEIVSDTATLSENLLVNAFRGAEDAIVDFVATGKLSFSDLINSMIRDLARLVIRSGFQALFGSVLALKDGGVFSGGQVLGFANGGAFGNGTVLTSPTLFGVGGQLGIAGEVDDEAVLPLERDSRGRLGVIAVGQGRGQARGVTIGTINIDARGASGDVEGRIKRALTQAAPILVQASKEAAVKETMDILTRKTL